MGPIPFGLYTIGKAREYKGMKDCFDLPRTGTRRTGAPSSLSTGTTRRWTTRPPRGASSSRPTCARRSPAAGARSYASSGSDFRWQRCRASKGTAKNLLALLVGAPDRAGERTLLDQLPEPRSTNDLDLFIRAEVLADLAKTRRVADAIRSLGYEPVVGAEYMQWRRPVPVGGDIQYVKLDLLVGPIGAHQPSLKVNGPRARPRGEVELHARRTDEVLTIDTRPVEATLAGRRSGGEATEEAVFVPDAFPYLMMKLFAFHDRRDDPQKDVGRHHALDLYF